MALELIFHIQHVNTDVKAVSLYCLRNTKQKPKQLYEYSKVFRKLGSEHLKSKIKRQYQRSTEAAVIKEKEKYQVNSSDINVFVLANVAMI